MTKVTKVAGVKFLNEAKKEKPTESADPATLKTVAHKKKGRFEASAKR